MFLTSFDNKTQGSLAQLDSQNPVLYVDFPQGRLKFLGTIVFPKNKYMLLKFGQKDVLCEDIFENMVRPCWTTMQSMYWSYQALLSVIQTLLLYVSANCADTNEFCEPQLFFLKLHVSQLLVHT